MGATPCEKYVVYICYTKYHLYPRNTSFGVLLSGIVIWCITFSIWSHWTKLICIDINTICIIYHKVNFTLSTLVLAMAIWIAIDPWWSYKSTLFYSLFSSSFITIKSFLFPIMHKISPALARTKTSSPCSNALMMTLGKEKGKIINNVD